MAAAEVPTEVGVSEREMGPFEKLCRSGLRVSRPARVPKVYGSLWKMMVLDHDSAFLPIGHLVEAYTVLASMAGILHRSAPSPVTFLLTGPKGIGKSHLFRKFAKHVADVSRRAADGRLTICCRADLRKRSSTCPKNFHEWLFHAIAEELEDLHRHPEVVQVLRNFAAHAAGSIDEEVSKEQLSVIFTLRDGTKAQRPQLHREMSSASELDRLDIASALLKQAGIAVIAVVDEAEYLFQERKFDFATTRRWQSQMEGVLSLVEPAIGMVVCASFQRARQLLLSDGSPHDFPPEYTHVSLRGNWNETKLKSKRLRGATWTETSLKAFLLTHACQSVDPSFALYRGEADKQQPSAAVDAAQEPSGAAAKEKMQPSEAALEMARKLDALFLRRLEREGDMSEEEKLKSSLECALELYGHTPRNLAHAASTLFLEWEPSTPWPEPTSPVFTEDLCEASEDHEQVMRSVLALLPDAKRAKLPGATALGFRSSHFVVPRGKLTRKLKESPEQPPAAAAGDVTVQGTATTTPAATRLIDSAIDKGWLVEHRGCLGLGSLGVYRRYGRGRVHKDVMMWMRHDGYGERAELPITRALARMPDQDGDVLVTDEGGEEEDSEGVAESQKQAVKASNSDTEGGQLAGVRMEVVAGRTADLPAQAAAPAESVGPPHAAAGAGGAGGGGQAAEAEADWRARARAAYEALEQVHESFKEYLALRRGAFWMKELPDVYGGGVIRVSYEVKDGVTTVWIMRVQVKRANQKTLENGDVNDAGVAAVRKAVEGLMDVESYSEAKRAHIEGKHMLVVRAVGDLIAAARLLCNQPKLKPGSMFAWEEEFAGYLQQGSLRIEDGGAMIALTHTVPDGMREHVEGQLGIRIVDGTNLRGYWDILQKASKREGVYLENAGAKAVEAAGSTGSRTGQDVLDALYKKYMAWSARSGE